VSVVSVSCAAKFSPCSAPRSVRCDVPSFRARAREREKEREHLLSSVHSLLGSRACRYTYIVPSHAVPIRSIYLPACSSVHTSVCPLPIRTPG